MINKFNVNSLKSSKIRVLNEILIAFRFAVVGGVATLIHMLVVWYLIEKDFMYVLSANSVAFITAFSFSFVGNYYWTFGKPSQKIRVMRRFFLISAIAFGTNTFLLSSLLNMGLFPPITSAICSAVIVPMITFLSSRLWVFK